MRLTSKKQISVFLGLVVALGIVVTACFPNGSPNTASKSPSPPSQPSIDLTVSAAASLTNVLQEIAPLYQESNATATVRYNFASSGALQRQVEQGSPVDVFIAAAAKPLNQLEAKNLIVPGSRRNLLKNRMVLIVPANQSGVSNLQGLTQDEVKRIAIGDPASVPAGQYAQQILEKQGLWKTLQAKYVLANNVRQVLQFVESGNAQAGLVYLTDAKTTNQVKIVETIADNLHDPIVYPIAVIKTSKHPEAATDFSNFLSSPIAQNRFTQAGFEIVPR
ncbi:molybdate ABC transporter substrate-binding protein [Alkalinema sp. FACHB-956]|uniref:molybdate ABC transporter substrate-binding protein n=1 Tax=Alkalinema sp. FACHB-956 TaxID=2692768 RepID=UPI00168A135C|nr:molybdate ABC transporter substrate-binding protein [Alkalinema sp. FACHB-956]MBD2327927.1 molybdate ABC transporter substrate-binding protein [Alkalinema sp. FACHB-956]